MHSDGPLDLAALAEALEAAGLPRAPDIAKLAAPSIRIAARRTATALPVGASRFGGSPDVPVEFEWPVWSGKPLTFLAQIDLTQVGTPALPASGWLLFFYEASDQPWGFDPKDAGCARVCFVDAGAQLKRRERPDVPPGAVAFDCCALDFTATIDLPSLDDRLLEDAGLELDWDVCDAATESISGVDGSTTYHHLLGHPQIVQNDMRGECQLVTSGIYCGDPSGWQGERAKELLRSAASEWQLLLQIDTDDGADGPGWMWGDSGRIYFWMRRRDLASRAFEKAWLILQCA